jgi:hypothetical protein
VDADGDGGKTLALNLEMDKSVLFCPRLSIFYIETSIS